MKNTLWTCKNCKARNSSADKLCLKCGEAITDEPQYHASIDSRNSGQVNLKINQSEDSNAEVPQ